MSALWRNKNFASCRSSVLATIGDTRT